MIDRDWRTYLDRKVVHFAYFYVLWVTIQFGFKAPAFAAESGWAHVGFLYLKSFIEPFGTLWFIYLLPVFFVVTKATRRLPPLLIWGVAALLEMRACRDRLDRDRRILRALCLFLYRLSVRGLRVRAVRPRAGAAGAGACRTGDLGGHQRRPGLCRLQRMAADLAGARALPAPAPSSSSARCWRGRIGSTSLRFCGEHSIVIYLAFFLPMAATRTLLLRTGTDPRHRHDLADRHDRGRVRRAGDLAARAQAPAPTSCSSARGVLDRAEEESRRQRLQPSCRAERISRA